MGSTLAEKMLARKVGRQEVKPGEIIEVDGSEVFSCMSAEMGAKVGWVAELEEKSLK